MILFGKKQYKSKSLEELIHLAQQDDLDAVEEIVKRNQENIYASFYYLSNNCEDILDLTQEALLKMARNIKKLKDATKFKAWLNQIVTRLFYDYIRSKNRKLKTVPIDKKDDEEQDRFNVADVPCKECTPEQSSLNSELNCIIERSIHKLPDSFRLAIVLREFQGLSYEEIAEITNTNVGTVKSRIARARNKLQEELKAYIA
ncbi:MAG TPA: sigma-70 family RNA polymerase sigma factor [Candidatus Limenecus avicola]|uniref:Sigma-70 family RNA polymerase sigma factor n=1 Tax=Candidatus Limenecus avicola TaxID=2840847 RepID=A0A9D1SQX1_9CLOT|nr:sigma-70 family RNA polymerase sigma factor [Clostridium sp.]CDC20539.1 rNA polymerase sigma factor sigma-70 family [Clostridium sp. CAG:306]HIU92110.1 sigma-70 family RNA polymerase sigma factor [Candidatus Limenecus avicola]